MTAEQPRLAPRDQLREAIRRQIATYIEGPGWDEEAAGKVVDLFTTVEERTTEQEITVIGDTHERYLWTRLLVCSHAVASGQCEGRPR
jgi:hypothetical protein